MSSSERSAERVGQAIEAFARVAETRLAASRIIEFDPATRKQLAVADTERLVQLLLQLVAQQRTLTALPDGARIANPTESHGGVHGVRSPDGPPLVTTLASGGRDWGVPNSWPQMLAARLLDLDSVRHHRIIADVNQGIDNHWG